MSIIEKFQTFIILLAVGVGLLFGQVPFIEAQAGSFILPFLLFMLYGLFLTTPIDNLKKAFKNIPFLSTNVLINFIWTPILAWLLGAVFLSDHPALWLGFILLLVTPCTDWYLVFTSIAKGNIALSTSVLPINLILQVILLPVYFFIFAGTMETVAFSSIIESVVFVLLLPLFLAAVTRYLFKNRQNILQEKIIPFFATSQIIFLSLAIVAMFASQGSYLLANLEVIYLLLIPLLLFFSINFLVAQTVGKVLKFSFEDTTSLNLTIIARNSPIALAIVVIAFPEQPLIALALVIGPLIELPVLAAVSQILLMMKKRTVA
ncbi:arsenic resistance protein [Alkalihalobacillus alcalophilus ATCC 27647 = CGMCC 1.3604]|uniref:Arsenic resistance protein n=1 Tax=Alkalihalobacillus alcalophilus ATCC 27647 = CGMCC 1.3604 TaxID=1218173 RepID=J8Q7Z0_ALKAL|nr:arsenic resistance protein [Alkalihalobacillus alcalophilus]AFV25839.1 arsenite transporter [Alkalihalobacillus alcalophilus ATCC 27647 = CGMCC 1.3604]KGA96927.1 arsenic resistance protein [Alkalihalobacillus alcalophilus ATCC 27647 = CGMCC 1.3604]MED1562281.1 arsenic resistance protein [Alkalihalobacillus alcalophilus]THG88816.1 arsenic resistance protein [Alkalihalobacillus alcalophilus ATCC 27647 = CGMCC 1.3604]